MPIALLDRCAHRNVPLSLGHVRNERLICAYHGWEYDGQGVCQRVPALCGVQRGKGRRVPTFVAREQQGLVWLYASMDDSPRESMPYHFPEVDNPRYTTVRWAGDFEATLYATLENILDVPHTAFLHRGLFRGVEKNEISVSVRRFKDRAEAEFMGEPRPKGWAGKILAPGGGTVEHFDRFIMPSIAQVEYKLGDNHVIINSALTPVSDFVTRLFAVVTFRTRIPAFLLKLAMVPLAKRILNQDKWMLKKQTAAVQQFGSEQFVSTDVDLLGPHIWRLLKQAEKGETPKDEVFEHQTQLIA